MLDNLSRLDQVAIHMINMVCTLRNLHRFDDQLAGKSSDRDRDSDNSRWNGDTDEKGYVHVGASSTYSTGLV